MRFFYFLLFSPFCLVAQEHIELQKKAEEFYKENNFKEAQKSAESALRFAEANVGKNHMEYVSVLHDLGNYKIMNDDLVGGITDLLTAEAIIINISVEKANSNIPLLSDISMAYAMAGMAEDAYSYAKKAVEYKEQLKTTNDIDYANLLGTLGEIERSMAKFDDAEINFFKSRKIFENNKLDNTIDYGTLLNNMAALYHDKANFIQAENYYKKAALIFLKTEGEYGENLAICYQNIGDLFSEMSAYDDAKKYLQKAEKIKLKLYGEESYSYATLINDMAYLHHRKGEYAASEELYLKAIQLKSKIIGVDHESYLRSRQNLAVLYSVVGREKRAEKILEEVVDKISKTKKEDPLNYADYIQNLGTVYTKTKKYSQADKLLKEALDIYKKSLGENHPSYINTLSNLAYLFEEQGSINEAKKYYELAINSCNTQNACGNEQQIILYNNMANIFKVQKNTSEELRYIEMCTGLANKSLPEYHPLQLSTNLQKAMIYADAKKIKEAEVLFTKILDAYMRRLDIDFSFMTEAEKAEFVSDINSGLNSYYAFVTDNWDKGIQSPEKIVNYRLATKALLLNSQTKIKKKINESNDSVLVGNYNNLRKNNNYLSKLYSLSNDDVLASGVNIDSLEKVSELLEKKISYLSSNSEVDKITWDKIRDQLDKDEVAIEIIKSDNLVVSGGVSYAALLITKTDPKPFLFFIPGGDTLDSKVIQAYRKNINAIKPDTISFKLLFEKIYNVVGPVRKIYFSGDGVYNQINISTLYNPNEKKYLEEEYDICLVTNLRDIISIKNKKEERFAPGDYAALFGFPDYTMALNNPAAVVNDDNLLALNRAGARGKYVLPPLPGTKTEVEEIKKVLDANKVRTEMFMAEKSDESTLKKLKNPFILHIATHGFFEANVTRKADSRAVPEALQRAAENPLLRSGVMLAGASNSYSASYKDITTWESFEDGILTAYEVMNLDLDSTELVVLSACETGLGDVKNGEGVYGLQRAFLVAGAKSIIMSLWEVSDDATRDLMIAFYKYWLETGNKHDAFKEAQKEIKFKYKHPYFWGAFVLIER